MKKTALLIVALAFISNPLCCQIVFDSIFENRTLRIDFFRIGNRQGDTVVIDKFIEKHCEWAGSLTQLIDPFDNGEYRILVRDSMGNIVYSRYYNSLFHEYCGTPQGMDSIVCYEEVVCIPFPKHHVVIEFQRRDSSQIMGTQYILQFHPEKENVKNNDSTHKNKIHRLHYKGNVHSKMDITIIPEGYGKDEQEKMINDMNLFKDYILEQEPFHSRSKDINIWGVETYGKTSGISNPKRNIHVESAVGSSYNTFGAERYLMTLELFKLHNLIDRVPTDHIVIMANSNQYGGGAIYNFYAISSLNSQANFVLPHELGHSIGGLADEYVDEALSYSGIHRVLSEPTEPNITTLVNFDSKWSSDLTDGTPIPTPDDPNLSKKENGPLGVYEGAGYLKKGIFRPTMHCMMRDYAPFCPICKKRINQIIDLYAQ